MSSLTLNDENEGPVRIPKRKLEEADMDITPMIDMTFLLLIFFLVASRMAQDGGAQLPKARFGTGVSTKTSIKLTVDGSGEGLAKVYKGDLIDPAALFPGSTVSEQEEAIAAYIESEAAGTPPKNMVLIKASAGTKSREVARVGRAAARAEVEQLYVGVTDKPTKR